MSATFERRYVATVFSESLIAAAAAERSAAASVSSNACSTVRSGSPSISRIRPLKTFFLFFLGTVRRPWRIAQSGIAFTTSRSVMPGCSFPLNRTRTDSGMSRGMKPSAPANATSPEPAGKEMPIGKRVCESPPVPTVSGSRRRFSHEWMTPSPGRSGTPPRCSTNAGSELCIFTSAGFGYAAVWQNDCMNIGAWNLRQASSFSSSAVIGPVVSWDPTVVIRGS